MKRIVQVLSCLFLVSCASAPSKKIIKNELILGNNSSKEKAEKIEKALTLGENQMTAGYSAEVTLLTEPLIIAQETEKGQRNMDSPEKIKKEIENSLSVFTKGTTCFLFRVHTYTIERAQFKNWVAKAKDSSGDLRPIEFSNVSGVKSVPSTWQDMNGRSWHTVSTGCTKQKIDLTKPFVVYLIPQILSNPGQNETSEFNWIIQ